MYNYEWDIETGGYILLPSKITGVTKEVRPVFSEELRFLGLDRDYGWDFPDCEEPQQFSKSLAEVLQRGNTYVSKEQSS